MQEIKISDFVKMINDVNDVINFSGENTLGTKLFKVVWYAQILQDIVMTRYNSNQAEYLRIATTLEHKVDLSLNTKYVLNIRTDVVHEKRLPLAISSLKDRDSSYFNIVFNDVLKTINYFHRSLGVNTIRDISIESKKFDKQVAEVRKILQNTDKSKLEVAATVDNGFEHFKCEVIKTMPPGIATAAKEDNEVLYSYILNILKK